MVATPLTKKQFHDRWSAGSDLLRHTYSGVLSQGPRDLWNMQRETSEQVQTYLAAIRKMGVEVCEEATLDDVVKAIGTHQEVVIVAHWRSERVALHHIIDPAGLRGVFEGLRRGDLEPPVALREAVLGALSGRDESEVAEMSVHELRRTCNAMLDAAATSDAAGGPPEVNRRTKELAGSSCPRSAEWASVATRSFGQST